MHIRCTVNNRPAVFPFDDGIISQKTRDEFLAEFPDARFDTDPGLDHLSKGEQIQWHGWFGVYLDV